MKRRECDLSATGYCQKGPIIRLLHGDLPLCLDCPLVTKFRRYIDQDRSPEDPVSICQRTDSIVFRCGPYQVVVTRGQVSTMVGSFPVNNLVERFRSSGQEQP